MATVFVVLQQQLVPSDFTKAGATANVVATVAYQTLVQGHQLNVELSVLIRIDGTADTCIHTTAASIHTLQHAQVIIVRHHNTIFGKIVGDVSQNVITFHKVLRCAHGAKIAEGSFQLILEQVELLVSFRHTLAALCLVGRVNHATTRLAVLAFKHHNHVAWLQTLLLQGSDEHVYSILIAVSAGWYDNFLIVLNDYDAIYISACAQARPHNRASIY